MWISISEKLCSQGYMFTAQQVESKYYTLERAYKNNRLYNSKTGRNRETIPFQEELDDLLSERKGINPEFRLCEEESAGVNGIQSEDLNSTSTTTTDESLLEKPRGRKRNFQKEIIEKIEDIVESSKAFQSKTLGFFNNEKREQSNGNKIKKRDLLGKKHEKSVKWKFWKL
ncbi:uncharacterized protein LOC118735343 [Rhagoletis pomonella]|uniref:uncharacterized protein LOC118735343 n=1 Tax=Rhagoletis pomonella TaxID=28610 RepID=UPI001785F9BA|nr:uncharacterized protein LOC118735343 [Rhagoletis pomonella]XP_036320936.1 uncharacterized protein LOC118735343 [Rhagoletis pomonella]